MVEADINYLAVLVCAGAAMLLGYVWYSKPVFGSQWMKALGKSEEQIKGEQKPTTYPLMMVSAFVMAFVLAHFVDYAEATTITGGLQAGFWAWLGFVVPSSASTVLFEGRSKKLYWISAGYYFVTLQVMGAILAVWI